MGQKKPQYTREQERLMCVRKRAFKSEAEGRIHILLYGQRAYKCPCCQRWHLTRRPKAGKP
jgi:hypothetical protein